jgi:hypothetical protein
MQIDTQTKGGNKDKDPKKTTLNGYACKNNQCQTNYEQAKCK